jgi:prevent-host-death family protein
LDPGKNGDGPVRLKEELEPIARVEVQVFPHQFRDGDLVFAAKGGFQNKRPPLHFPDVASPPELLHASAAKARSMMTYICYTTFMANVKIAYAKAHLPELLERVAQGERIVISRYNTPMAELVPAPKTEKVQRKFGTGKGKAMLIDPRALDPMTDDEAEAFLQGRY